ncbi:MAG TPA: 50S ribosomal protein L31e [Candidatus Norongarragalinales archaeon]|jgi:large subunit ribosomal protein L31e|nr:50S ribosomal protein L31e [Candidatus Norongarragalinales archaeon]
MAESEQKLEGVRSASKSLKEQAEANPVKDSPKEAKLESKKEGAAEKKSDAGAKKHEEEKGKKHVHEEKKTEKKREVILERTYIIPLFDAYKKPAKFRTNKAMKMLREFISRHMKAAPVDVKIDEALNSAIIARGATRPPKTIKVSASKEKTGSVIVALAK